MSFRNTRLTAVAASCALAAITLTACGTSGDTAANSPMPTSDSTAVSAPSTSSSTSATSSATASSTTTSTTTTSTAARVAQDNRAARSQARPVIKTVTETRVLPFDTVTRTDATLAKGTNRISQYGVAGSQRVTVAQTSVNGRITDVVVTNRVTVKQPVTKIVVVGTKAAAPRVTSTPTTTTAAQSTGGLDLRRAAMWDRIAMCESTGNWSINTGNGYYGGLQFDIGTWLSAGGGKFASRADLASRAQQITIANKVYDQRGLQPWGCARAA